MDVDKVRILVLGDSGVGKTTLIHLLCHQEFLSNPYWTIGCSIHVKESLFEDRVRQSNDDDRALFFVNRDDTKLHRTTGHILPLFGLIVLIKKVFILSSYLVHEYGDNRHGNKPYFLELFDVGGSSSHAASRGIFYNVIHGIILVHDLSNRKSLMNLRKWLQEALGSRESAGMKSPIKEGPKEYDPEQFAGTSNVPILLVGTKLNQVASNKEMSRSKPGLASEFGAESINLDCSQVKGFLSDRKIQGKLKSYFDKVIDKCYQGNPRSTSQTGIIDRRFRLSSLSMGNH
ncbi:Rab-like protein 3 [Trichoplax sp. H2]|nr:Rab-like protein 3 [Trichoplax sp. H2]|eukprot:RDD41875.1 Rab-like protein 3 [Trichoplax sp. H2]